MTPRAARGFAIRYGAGKIEHQDMRVPLGVKDGSFGKRQTPLGKEEREPSIPRHETHAVNTTDEASTVARTPTV